MGFWEWLKKEFNPPPPEPPPKPPLEVRMRQTAERIRKAEAQCEAAEAEYKEAEREASSQPCINAWTGKPDQANSGQLYYWRRDAKEEAARNPNTKTLQAVKEAQAAFQRGVARTNAADKKRDKAKSGKQKRKCKAC